MTEGNRHGVIAAWVLREPPGAFQPGRNGNLLDRNQPDGGQPSSLAGLSLDGI
jgi:hypothetical protein